MGVLSLAVAGLLVVGGADRRAPPTGSLIALHWDAPAQCPDARAFESAVLRRFGRDEVPDDPLRVTVSVDDEADTFRLRLWIDDEAPRELEGDRCGELADAAALIVALRLEQVSSAPELSRALTANHPREVAWSRADPPSEVGLKTTVPRREPTRWRFAVRVAAGIEAGALPGVGADVAVAIAVFRRHFAGEVFAHYAPPRTAYYEGDVGDEGGAFQLWAIGGQACGVPTHRRFRFPLCGGLEFGAMNARGVGLSVRRRDREAWGAALASAGVDWQLAERFALVLRAQPAFAFIRPGFAAADREPVFRAAPVSVRAWLGIEFRTPTTDRRVAVHRKSR